MVSNAVVRKLAELRLQFQQDTEPDAWPEAAEREVTLLADVVLALGGDELALVEVLGVQGVQLVAAVMDGVP